MQQVCVSLSAENTVSMLKVCLPYFLTNFYFSPNDGPSETMKDVFYFI